MNALRNRVQLIGRMGDNADVRKLESGKALARFSMATNEVYYNSKGEKVEETTWHNVVAWGKLAETIEKYTHKGSEIAIQGKLVNRSYESKEGEKKYITEIHAAEVLLMGSKAAAVG
ncbi:single-stranded DNA-binding protein [Pararhodonellum marinum]|uniref:single-stranded DNA-binding protein n=1 Tax=Pararhodonellum marinum TaxID=2755358 RepID=UPI00188DD006|nr:single-stranded DNA-binding protein [Pararhodonellum marinum]